MYPNGSLIFLSSLESKNNIFTGSSGKFLLHKAYFPKYPTGDWVWRQEGSGFAISDAFLSYQEPFGDRSRAKAAKL